MNSISDSFGGRRFRAVRSPYFVFNQEINYVQEEPQKDVEKERQTPSGGRVSPEQESEGGSGFAYQKTRQKFPKGGEPAKEKDTGR